MLVFPARGAGAPVLVNSLTFGSGLAGVGVNPDANHVYVASELTNRVFAIDAGTDTILENVHVANRPRYADVNPSTGRVYATEYVSKNVTVIGGATNRVVADVAVDGNPLGVETNPTTNRIYVASRADAAQGGTFTGLSVINGTLGSPTQNTVIATLPLGNQPTSVAVNPTTERIYVTNEDGTVAVIDAASNTRVATIGVPLPAGVDPSEGVEVNPTTNRVYVAHPATDSVSVIDGSPGSPTENTVIATVPVGDSPSAVDVDPILNRAYVGNSVDETVSVIAGGTNHVVATVPLPDLEGVAATNDGLGVNESTSRLYVTHRQASQVSVLEDQPTEPSLTDTDPDSPANENSPRIKGSAEEDAIVRLYTTTDCSGSAVATGLGSTFASPGLPVTVADDSTTYFRATATDGAEKTSPCSSSSIAYREDSTPPVPPTVSDTDPDSPANDNAPLVKGSSVPNSTVRLYTSADCSGSAVATGTADDFASPGLPVSVGDGSTTTFRATAADRAGNESACSPTSITYVEDSTPPDPPTLTDTDPDSPANDNNPRVKGSAEANSTVRLYTTSDCSGAATATGTAAEFASSGIAVSVADDSTTTFRATATDRAGNASACSTSSITYREDSSAPPPPTLTDTDPDSPANDNSPNVKGSAQPGTTVRLYTTSDCPAPAAATGTAADFGSPGLAVSVADDSTSTFRATATDQAGNASACSTSSITYREDSKPPAEPTLTDTDPGSPANDNTPKLKGSAEVGATVTLYTTSDCSGAAAATGTAGDFSSPGLAFAVADDSVTTFRATARDRAGNVSGCSSNSITYVEDSTAPEAPDLTATNPASPANDNSPQVRGSAEPASTVRLYASSDCSGTVAAAGSATELASPGIQASVADDSATEFHATATDRAGNTSPCSSSSIAYSEDSTAPAEPTLSDTDPQSPANDNTPQVKGSAEAGATVRLYPTADCSGSPAAVGSAAQLASGLEVSVLDDSTTTLDATATDRAGNTSGCSSSAITYREDSTAPDAPTLTGTDPDPPANDNTPLVKGSAQAGSTVRIYAAVVCAGTPAATGSAAELASPGLETLVLDDSTTIFRANATDRAGNVSACSTGIAYKEDSTPPPTPSLAATVPEPPANDNTPLLRGSTEAGATVRIYTNADCAGTPAAIGSSGDLSGTGIQVSVPDDSTTTFYAVATDRAGNVSSCPDRDLSEEDQPAFREYYDLAADPWQLTNYLNDADASNDPAPEIIELLHRQLMSDLRCAGRGGLLGLPACP